MALEPEEEHLITLMAENMEVMAKNIAKLIENEDGILIILKKLVKIAEEKS